MFVYDLTVGYGSQTGTLTDEAIRHVLKCNCNIISEVTQIFQYWSIAIHNNASAMGGAFKLYLYSLQFQASEIFLTVYV